MLEAFMVSDTMRSYRRIRTAALSVCLLVVTMLLSSAVRSTNYQDALPEYPWTNYQFNERGTGFTHTFGTFHNLSSITYQNIKAFGSDFQPIAIDLDGDGITELITSQATLLRVSHITPGSHDLQILDEYTTDGSQATNAAAAYLTTFGGDVVVVYLTTANMLYVFGFNGTNIQALDTYNLTALPTFSSISSTAGLKCHSTTEYAGGDTCYFVSWNAGTTTIQPFEYDVDGNSFTSLTAYNSGGQPYSELSLLDWDNDGVLELAVGTAVGANSKLYVFDTATGNAEVNYNPKSIVGRTVYHNVFYNIDGGGKSEIITMEGSTSICYLNAYNTAGSTVWSSSFNAAGGTSCPGTAPVIATMFSATYADVCYQTDSSYTSVNRLLCYDVETGAQTMSYQDNTIRNNYLEPLVAADVNNDGYADIIANKFIIFPKNDTPTFQYSPTYQGDGRLIFLDMDGDSAGEIVSQSAGQTWVLWSSFDNAPPALGTRTLGQSYASPICAGTTLTFTATECGAEPCHYTNDNEFDTERLSSTCGTNTTMQNGTFSGANPQLGCYYGAVGSYPSIYVYLQDAANRQDYTQYKVVSVTVVNGTPGFSCNLPPSTETTTGSEAGTGGTAPGTLSQSDIDFIVNTLTGGGSSLVKMLLMAAFTLGIIILLAKYGIVNPVIHAAGIFGVWILCAIVGLISWIYVIIFAFVIVGASAVYFVKGGSQPQ
jgi:hypothetical protein